MEIKIRAAKIADMDSLLHFEQQIITTERPFDPSLKPGYVTYYDLEKLVTSEDSYVAVAELNGELVGSGYALKRQSEDFERHPYFAYLGFMYVAQECRGQGVNKLIIDALMDWSKQQGLKEIRLEVFEQNEIAIKAYEKYGFKKASVKMRVELP